jgi:trypsin
MMKCLYLAVLASTLGLGCNAQEGELDPVTGAELGQHEQDIIGGMAANPGQFPWQARLTFLGQPHCGGSLIHPKWVLTAGHCVVNVAPVDMQVILGDHTISQTEPTEQSHTVKRFIKHPSYHYEGDAPVNDVALIELNSPATLNSAVQTIALQTTTASFANYTASGWGWTSGWANQASDTLMFATLPVSSSANCDGAPLVRDLFWSEMCAGFADGSQSGCHGDSGGPLVTQTNPPKLVGVVSWGRAGTCDSYTVFARVSALAPWINSQVNCVPCPMSGSAFDGANCYAGTPPAGTTPFVYSGKLYYTPAPGPSCPMSGSAFDGANCYRGTPPAGTTPFVYGGNLYYTPVCTP